jgi:hypothetical protein
VFEIAPLDEDDEDHQDEDDDHDADAAVHPSEGEDQHRSDEGT